MDYNKITELNLDQQTSKINSGFLQINRLDILWKDAHKHGRDGNYKALNEDLDRVWCELGGDVKEDDALVKKYENFLLEYAKLIVPKKERGFDSATEEERMGLIKQKMILIKKELFLRRLQNIQGKGTAYKEDDDSFE